MRILTTGGRDRHRALDKLHVESTICVLIHGAATGADTFDYFPNLEFE